MKTLYKSSYSLLLIALISGCSGKSFTMQEYADKWFNNKEEKKEEVKTSEQKSEESVKTEEKAPLQKEESLSKNDPKELKAETKTVEAPAKAEVKPPKKVEGAAIRKGVPSQVAWSSTDKHKDGQMQKSLDTWTKEEWEPAFEGDEEQAKEDEKASEHFTIQHYIDKRARYLEAEEEKWKKSGKKKPEANYEKMNRLPVIGK